jgi:murein DD-endopeptidase MepM/ murein hydrolase activator NlpD
VREKDFIIQIIPLNSERKMRRFKLTPFKIVSLIIFFVGLLGSSIFLFLHLTSKLDDFRKISSLERENKILNEKLTELKEKIAHLEALMDTIYKKDLTLRTIVGLDYPPPEIKEMGIGGYIEEPPEPELRELKELDLDIERLIRLAEYEKKSFAEIEDKLVTDKRRRDHTPSIMPVSGIFTSGFGRRRDPFTGRMTFHPGIDLAAPPGAPIYAPADGVVRRIRWDRGYGLVLEIDHGYGVATRYAHISKAAVKIGTRVKRGQIIAYVGNTGRSTGPHLHYEVLVYRKNVNPFKYIISQSTYYD